MLRVVRRTAVTLLLSGLLMAAGLLVATPASACSCVGQTTQEFFDRADAVFTARLVSREEPAPMTSSADPALHVFAVDTVFKGTAHEAQGVLSPVSGATCGLELVGEGPFVVFASRSTDLGGEPFATLADDQYAAFLCGGTAPLTPALEAELTALSPRPAPSEEPPVPGAAGPADAGSALPGPAIAAAVALGLVVGTGALVHRRRRSAAGRPR
jgi:hypothetical protein